MHVSLKIKNSLMMYPYLDPHAETKSNWAK